MSDTVPEIVLTSVPIDPHALRTLVDRHFVDMVKFVKRWWTGISWTW